MNEPLPDHAKAVVAALEEAYAPSQDDAIRSWERIADWRRSGTPVAADAEMPDSGRVTRLERKTRALQRAFVVAASLAVAALVIAAVSFRWNVSRWMRGRDESLTSARPPDGQLVPPAEVAYLLQPALDRGAARAYPRIAAGQAVVLRLAVDAATPAVAYSAVIEDENGHSLFAATDLTKSFLSGTWAVTLYLPGSTLAPGDYVVSLHRASEGHQTHVNDYAFAVQR